MESAGRYLTIRLLALRGLATARLDRCATHHLHRARALDHGAGACRIEKTVMSFAAATAVPEVVHVAAEGARLPEKISIRNLNFYYGSSRALKDISVPLFQGKVTAFIGPSGCGKSTLLRVLNRMYDLYPNQRAEGEVTFDGEDVLSPKQD